MILNKLQKISHTQNKGFSLVEMMVSVSLFMVVVVISVGGLMTLIYAGSVAESTQSVTGNLSLAVDSMSRNIRTGYSYYCASSIPGALPSGTADCANGESAFVFTNSRTGDRTGFRLNSTDNSIEQKRNTESWIRITSVDINVQDLEFYVTGSTAGDSTQGAVRMLVNAVSVEGDEVVPFYIQTLLTSRLLDV